MRAKLGTLFTVFGLAGMCGEVFRLKLPSASWFFDTSRRLSFLHRTDQEWYPYGDTFPWYGWVTAVLVTLVGLVMLGGALKRRAPHPATLRRQRRFREVKRGVWSLRILLGLVALASLDFMIVGDKPLFLKNGDTYCFPAFERKVYKGADFGLEGELAEAPANFRALRKVLHMPPEKVLVMPLIPYAPTGDAQPPLLQDLKESEGQYLTTKGEPYSGLAARVYAAEDGTEEVSLHIRYRLREGRLSGPADGWSRAGDRVYSASYGEGAEMLSQEYYGEGRLRDFKKASVQGLKVVQYHPAPPNRDHLLGTDSSGNDVLAYLFGGLQVNIQAALFYIPCVYCIGVTIGLLMGYFGGIFDLVLQRIIEALEAIPFLFVILIISSVIPIEFKGLGMILGILIAFGWMGKTYLMRTAAYREKARDYVASARVIGASNLRVLIKHILPNILSILVTVIPFAISGVVTSITSLDYLGFGLPPRYASWGKLLNDGLSNLSSPWLVSAAFLVLVTLLILITFVGEAVREAWDPRKFTTYR